MTPQGLSKLIGVALLIFCGIIMAFSGTYVVKPGYRGVGAREGHDDAAKNQQRDSDEFGESLGCHG